MTKCYLDGYALSTISFTRLRFTTIKGLMSLLPFVNVFCLLIARTYSTTRKYITKWKTNVVGLYFFSLEYVFRFFGFSKYNHTRMVRQTRSMNSLNMRTLGPHHSKGSKPSQCNEFFKIPLLYTVADPEMYHGGGGRDS